MHIYYIFLILIVLLISIASFRLYVVERFHHLSLNKRKIKKRRKKLLKNKKTNKI
ncbi:hypothetical protein EV08_0281 [Prochlorococcus marinus str. SS2]|uniref:Uncharacterized protein n=1 Tax=Prochlorococcus marinus (strain SARG / CCMP1375 / SS120) TaxID=167539 RepID=Q7VAR3_PROMA|nr:Predicted protein [Prochlorococcus marinus subsp. marinus str. CCMP1375]KGG22107.1 hypothetical protein EV08_0281 [Prochlorococcus marinus str. SS2]